MVWIGKDIKDHLVSTPCHGQGDLSLGQVAQSSIHPSIRLALNASEEGAATTTLGKPIPVPHHPQSKEFPPNILLKPTLSLNRFLFVLSLHALVKSPSPFFL